MARNKKDKKDRAGKHSGVPRRGLGHKEEQFLHVREFSQGKPNELSFNVLEQKAAAADETPHGFRARFGRKRGSSTPVDAGAAAQEVAESSAKSDAGSSASAPTNTIPAPAPFLGVDSQAEIARRQQRRRQYRRMSIAVVVVICVALVVGGGYWAFQRYQQLNTSIGVLKEACSLIEESDEVTVAIDSYLQTSFNDDTVTNAQELLDKIPSAEDQLETARVYASRAQGELEGSQTDREAAERALNTIAARETLLDSAEQILTQDIAAKQAIDAMDSAWEAIQEGNALMSHAAEVVSNTTEENVATSTEYTTNAQAKFAEARTLIEQAQEYVPSADLTDELAHVDKRSEAATEALASNAAILLQDRATAESHNDAYNAADAAAAEMAASLPENFSQSVIDAYASAIEELQSTYESARNDAATNDAYLRDYLDASLI